MENRIIKFRAFKDGKMYPVHTLDMYEHQKGKLAGFTHPNEKECIDLDGAVFMQFTGLKDKNGVEIFEGDVVSLYDHPTGIDSCVTLVIFGHGSFIADFNHIHLSDYGTAWTEVKGNIYEHPHLNLKHQ